MPQVTPAIGHANPCQACRSHHALVEGSGAAGFVQPGNSCSKRAGFQLVQAHWSDKRSSLLLGRMWLLAFIYFNKRVLERRPKPQPEAEWQQFAQWMQHMPVEA
ncbi:hypothetical protein QJQ45_005983 [Haematococcus lacustris]|nr:hypothetical protein QJQ45_005983 [Haematococcus lacustris]